MRLPHAHDRTEDRPAAAKERRAETGAIDDEVGVDRAELVDGVAREPPGGAVGKNR